jgi:hypothetical protein
MNTAKVAALGVIKCQIGALCCVIKCQIGALCDVAIAAQQLSIDYTRPVIIAAGAKLLCAFTALARENEFTQKLIAAANRRASGACNRAFARSQRNFDRLHRN